MPNMMEKAVEREACDFYFTVLPGAKLYKLLQAENLQAEKITVCLMWKKMALGKFSSYTDR